jgi:hypothetical protein
MGEKRKSTKELARATLASVTKEMARPRFAESARKEEEEAHHRVAKHKSVSFSTSLQVGAPPCEREPARNKAADQ